MDREFVQQTSRPGCRRCRLTGERTLPDVPEENYWYRRHLAVYEWIAARVGGLRVVDMACGEGYGSDLLAGGGGERGRGRRQPGGARARAAALPAPQPALRARPGRGLRRALRRGRLPADDRARAGRRRHPRALQVHAGQPRRRLRLDPEPADPGAARGREVGQPLARPRVPRRGVPRPLRGPLRPGRAARPLPRPQAARPRAGAEARLGPRPQGAAPERAVLRRFTPAISSSDFALRPGSLDTALDFLAVCHA